MELSNKLHKKFSKKKMEGSLKQYAKRIPTGKKRPLKLITDGIFEEISKRISKAISEGIAKEVL